MKTKISFHFLMITLLFFPIILKAAEEDPSIFCGILIQDQDLLIPYFLRSFENLDYDKKRVCLQLDVCNENPHVKAIVSDWVSKHRTDYESISIVDCTSITQRKENREKNRVLGSLKDDFLETAASSHYDYCFITSSGVFLLPKTLKHLMQKDLPILAPLLRPTPEASSQFRNFFADITEDGYYKDHPSYTKIANRIQQGTFKVPCVHSTYLINTKFCGRLSFSKEFKDWEFLSFSKNARENEIDQYICNEKEFGFFLHFSKELTLEEEKSFELIGMEREVTPALLASLLSKQADDPDLKKYLQNFNFSDYAIYRVQNKNLFYLDEVNDYIKNYVLKQGLDWEEHIHNVFKQYVKPGTIAIDVGGHIGTHTLNLSRLVGEKGKVYVFEPQAKMFCELAINMHLNQCKNVEMFHNALGSEEKWIEMTLPDEEWKKPFGPTLVNEGHGTVGEITINSMSDRAKTLCLDSLGLNTVSFIKMDVEGYESEVIKGALKTIARNHPVMIIEIFNNQDREKKLKEIENLGYSSQSIGGDDFLFIPILRGGQKPIQVAWEGSFIDFGSLSNVNRFFAKALEKSSAITLRCIDSTQRSKKRWKSSGEFDKSRKNHPHSEEDVEITIRHEWPPNWTPPTKGKWVLIQPWEFGALPTAWIDQIKQVDEVWVPTEFVKNEYIYSGIPADKVQVVPNGYDPAIFNLATSPLQLATQKKFKFLFLGGTIHRKGPDILLESYLSAFSDKDDVCLVIKDFGGEGPYKGQTYKNEIVKIQNTPGYPEILYMDSEIKTEEIASLYRACDCLVLPYRGEGFALPVLEAMASGLPVIVTSGGATDDFVSDNVGWRIPSKKVSIGNKTGDFPLIKEGWLLEPDKIAFTGFLRWAHSHPSELKEKGLQAAQEAKQWSWENASSKALQRIFKLTQNPIPMISE